MTKNLVKDVILGIKVGSAVSVIGNVIYNYETNELKILNPFVILDNPQNYKKYLKFIIVRCKIFMTISVLFAYLFLLVFSK